MCFWYLEGALGLFGRRILRSVFGAVQDKGQWRGLNFELYKLCDESDLAKYSKTSLIRTNWERTLVQISESPNYRSAAGNMFREVIK
jgi:hypothetical protein